MMSDRLLVRLIDEMHAATVFIMEHGKLELGTPQSARLIKTIKAATEISDG
jgi:hypothetical protein